MNKHLLRELQEKWEHILESEGMPADIGTENGIGEARRRRTSNAQSAGQIVARIEYYDRAAQWVHLLECVEDARVWELHSEGRPVRYIATTVGLSKTEIHRRIKRIRSQAGL